MDSVGYEAKSIVTVFKSFDVSIGTVTNNSRVALCTLRETHIDELNLTEWEGTSMWGGSVDNCDRQ